MMLSSNNRAASRYTNTSIDSSTSSSLDHQKPSSKIKSLHQNNKQIIKGSTQNVKNEHNFASMVRKFMDKRPSSKSKKTAPLIVPTDFIAKDLRKAARKEPNLGALPKKLFGKVGGSGEKKAKALTEVKANTRTLAMVLRSERELLSLNKEQEDQIAELKSLLEDRNHEVEKLKDLCLKQREEIKALKSAVLFPDEMNSQLHEILEKQGSELKQARQVIPTLQRQISSLTGQLQNLSEDLQEVKAVKYTGLQCFDGNYSSPRTPAYNEEEAANSLDFSSDGDDPTTPDSPDDMLLKDMNPCLTPCYSKMKSKEYRAKDHDYAKNEEDYEVSPWARKLSRSSDHPTSLKVGRSSTRACVAFCRSDESKSRHAKRIGHRVL